MSCLFVQIRASLLAIASSEALLCPMSGWVCQWKPFWIPVEDSFKKAFMEEWVFISDVPSEGPSSAEDPMAHNITIRRTFSNTVSLCPVRLCTYVIVIKPIPPLDRCLCCSALDVRLGLSMEAILDPGRRFVQESL